MRILLPVFFFLFLFSSDLKAQDAGAENSNFGIQTGFLGLWAHNETRLGDEFVLRTEVGFDFGFYSGFFNDGTGFIVAPVINISPRWYYNLKKRAGEQRKVVNNSANFLALEVSYHPDWFVLSDDNINVVNQISFIPKWGMKRTIGKHFVYELGAGLGYGYAFYEDYPGVEGDIFLDLHIRLGYSF